MVLVGVCCWGLLVAHAVSLIRCCWCCYICDLLEREGGEERGRVMGR